MPPKTKRPKAAVVIDSAAAPTSTRPDLPLAAGRERAASPSPARAGMDMDEDLLARLQSIHLVVDFDATFVATRTDMSMYQRYLEILKTLPENIAEDLRSRTFIFTLDRTRMWTIVRPGATDFFEFAAFYFKRVSVWSAGRADYVSKIASLLFPPHLPRSGVIFSWDDCATAPAAPAGGAASPSHSSDTGAFWKPLAAMADVLSDGADLSRMLILDDRSDIAVKNASNLVKIPAFEPRVNAAELALPDTALADFTRWLMLPETIRADDVRTLPKTSIFK